MTERALSFGSVASDYERYRPGYPDALVERVLDHAGRPVRTALEIGAGTGKATRAFAGRGIAITATDPDAAMLAELCRHVPADVVTVRAAFEDLDLGRTHDLVYVAAALHWTRSEGRWPRVAALLAPGGTFASFGGQLNLADPDVAATVAAARASYLASDELDSPDGTAASASMQWPGTELEESALFIDVRQEVLERRLDLAADDYIGHLSTISAYLQLTDAERAQVFDRIRSVLPDRVALTADVTLHLARTRDA